MPRPKGSKNVSPLQELCDKQINIKPLDAAIPTDSNMTTNQVRAVERETRAKINEIINIINLR